MSHLNTAYQYGFETAVKQAGYTSVEQFIKVSEGAAALSSRAAGLLKDFGINQLSHVKDLVGTTLHGAKSGLGAAFGDGRAEKALSALAGLIPTAALAGGGYALYDHLTKDDDASLHGLSSF